MSADYTYACHVISCHMLYHIEITMTISDHTCPYRGGKRYVVIHHITLGCGRNLANGILTFHFSAGKKEVVLISNNR